MERMRLHMEKGKRDTRGFTLIEVIITIAILAVVTVPLLSYFSDAARHNAESRKKQNAVVEAQDILESFKNTPYSLDDSSVVVSAAPEWSIKTPASTAGAPYTLKQTVTVDKSTFDVEAKISPVSMVQPNSTELPTATDLNYEKTMIGSMDSTKDVLVSEHGQTKKIAAAYFSGKYTEAKGSTKPIAQFEKGLDCTIHVVLNPTPAPAASVAHLATHGALAIPSANPDDVVVKVTYEYKSNSAMPGDGQSFLNGVTYTEDVKAAAIKKTELNNIFLFYDPLNGHDTVLFSKGGGDISQIADEQIKVFLVAQSSIPYDASITPAAGYSMRPNLYSIQVGCNDLELIKKFKKNGLYCNLSNKKHGEMIGSTPPSGFTAMDSLAAYDSSGNYTLVDQEYTNRVADIEVVVYKDGKEYTRVTGSKVQN